VKVVRLPWAEAGSRFTALFEGLAIAWLKSASQQAVADLLRLSWDEMHGIMERAVRRNRFAIWAWTRRRFAKVRTM
jgi:transposase